MEEQKKNTTLWYVVGGIIVIALAVIFIWKTPQTELPGVNENDEQAETTTSSTGSTGTGGSVQPAKRVLEKGVYVNIVTYTGTKFIPQIMEISGGEEVRFVNASNGSMRIASVMSDGKLYLNSINQPESVGKGGTYQLMVTEKGTWGFRNIDNKTNTELLGLIYVK